MKAALIQRYRGEVRISEVPRPSPGPGDLLVQVRAASVNPVDFKRGGAIVSIGGLPDAKFARARGLNPLLVLALGFLSRKETRLARRNGIRYEYLLMHASGDQLSRIAELLDGGIIHPVIDRTFPLAETAAALAYSESGRATGKVVITP